ncbi:MAG: LytTR family transcriptional regulator [Chitinophagaceae bacterium]|nr:LytTR family transcriptional regulator [Chitinophagaceae bacterium]
MKQEVSSPLNVALCADSTLLNHLVNIFETYPDMYNIVIAANNTKAFLDQLSNPGRMPSLIFTGSDIALFNKHHLLREIFKQGRDILVIAVLKRTDKLIALQHLLDCGCSTFTIEANIEAFSASIAALKYLQTDEARSRIRLLNNDLVWESILVNMDSFESSVMTMLSQYRPDNEMILETELDEYNFKRKTRELGQKLNRLGFFMEALQVGIVRREEKFLFFKDGTREVKIAYKDIVMITSANNYVRVRLQQQIHTDEGSLPLYLTTLKSIVLLTVNSSLLRANKTTIVHKDHVSSIAGDLIIMAGTFEVILSPIYRDEFLKKMGLSG